jgi:transcriptional regulator with XRE-family HTH domain
MLKDRIKELRKSNGLSMKSFAESIGISGTSASLYESGKQNPGKKTLDKICEVYGVTKEWLTDDEPRKAAVPVVEKAEKTVAPVVEKAEKTVAPATEKAEKTVVPATEKAEKTVAPVVEKAEKAVAPTAEKVGKTIASVVGEAEKAVVPVAKKAEDTVAPISGKVEKAVEAVVVETGKTVQKVTGGKKNKKAVEPVVMIESAMGAQISMEEIMKRVDEAVKAKERLAIYVKPEDNKAYYSSEAGEGSVDLW